MAWIYLLVAGLLEVAWAIGLKYTDGFSRLWPSAWTLAAMALSVAFLGLALRDLPVGTGYAVWTASAPSAPRSSACTCFMSRRPLFAWPRSV